MRICEYINVNDERLLDGLSPVVSLMARIEALPDGEEVTIDFADTKFVTPVCLLSLIVYLARCGRKVSLKNVTEYLGTIGLSNGGIKPDQMRRTEFLATMEKYSTKSYIPIVNFAAGRNIDDKEAIKAANRGISSKNLPDAENRGYGIQTSKRMLVEGLGGQYLMISGGCLYLKTPVNSSKFNYVNYIE